MKCTILVGDRSAPARYILGAMPNRLKIVRTERGLTQEALADLAGTTHATIQRLESGKRRLTDAWIDRLARAMRCRPSDLLEASEALGPIGAPIVNVPLISWVEAGALAEVVDPYEPADYERLVAVPYERQTLIALRVNGSSMNRVAPEGCIIVVDYSDRELVSGKYFVIRVDDRATFKRYRADPPRFEPDSTEQHDTIFPDDEVHIVGRVVRVISELD